MRVLVKLLLFFGILAIGALIYLWLSAGREQPKRVDEEVKPTIVTAMLASTTEKPVTVTAMGTVTPAREVTIFPEVSGRIVYQHPELVPGGRFQAGEVLVRIDPRDYDLAIQQQQAAVSQADLNLASEQSRKAVAEREWELIKDEVQPTEQGRRLALREIQLLNAQVALESAKSGLQKAELARSRATIRAPFNAIVLEEFVDPGQVVGPGSRVAILADADRTWVRAAVPVDRLTWIQLPGVNAQAGSEVRVLQQIGAEQAIERPGRVIRLLGDLDPKGKMARVLIEVDSPFDQSPQAQQWVSHAVGAQAPAQGDLSPLAEGGAPAPVPTPDQQIRAVIPLLIGSWVTVHIQGPRLDQVISLPRRALREQDQVWVINAKDQLEIRAVRVVWARNDTVYVAGELQAGDQVITSRIATPVEGMAVHTNGHQQPGDGGALPASAQADPPQADPPQADPPAVEN